MTSGSVFVRRAGDRYRSQHRGITTWHCFATGAHYDPDDVGFGPVVGVDEHHLDPGVEFAEHPHRGVAIASWVLRGRLTHTGPDGSRTVAPGEVFLQNAVDGLRHTEGNAGPEPLVFVQTTWLAPSGGSLQVIHAEYTSRRPAHLFVGAGSFTLAGIGQPAGMALAAGDSARASEPFTVDGDGDLLLVTW